MGLGPSGPIGLQIERVKWGGGGSEYIWML